MENSTLIYHIEMIPIHVAKRGSTLLVLKKGEEGYFWEGQEAVYGTVEEAIEAGYAKWKPFRLIGCGFRYTLPERDEVGSVALFFQMAMSYEASDGVYFDEELGHSCYVDFASDEALEIWRKIKSQSAATA